MQIKMEEAGEQESGCCGLAPAFDHPAPAKPAGGGMGKRVLLIQGHPDTAGGHLCRALEEAYAKGAAVGGHELRRIDIGSLDFPLLKSQAEWEH
ncbi:MAG: hypothetical protein ABWY27_06140, partial [Telluria sp.]